MKTTDYGYAVTAKVSGSVVGSEDGVTGAADRAEQTDFVVGKNMWVADTEKARRGITS